MIEQCVAISHDKGHSISDPEMSVQGARKDEISRLLLADISTLQTVDSSPNVLKRRRLNETQNDNHESKSANGSYEELNGMIKGSMLNGASNNIELKTSRIEFDSPVFESVFLPIFKNLEDLAKKYNDSPKKKSESEEEKITTHSIAYTSPNVRKKRLLNSLNSTGNEVQDTSHDREGPNPEELKSIKEKILATFQDVIKILKEVKGEQHGNCDDINLGVEAKNDEFESTFPLKSKQDFERMERLIYENKDNIQNNLITWLKQQISSTTCLETFVTTAWKQTVADSLGRHLNWEGRRDARILDGQKISVKNSQLVRIMKIALQTDPRYKNRLTLDFDFKKKTNSHFRNAWCRFARANPDHPDVVKSWRLRRTQQESQLNQSIYGCLQE